MAEQQDQERTEKATPFKLQQARQRGQVVKSMEVNSLFALLMLLAMLYFLGERLVLGQLGVSKQILSGAHRLEFASAELLDWFEAMFGALFDLYWPFFAALMLVGILANMLQTGPVFSFFPLKPDPKRLSPVAGFKRVFSMKLLFESGKTFIKLAIFASIIYLVMSALLPTLLALTGVDSGVYAKFLLENARTLIYKLLLVFIIVALLDLAYSRWDFAKRMRMSRRELKEEVKRREGDPQIRARIRELQKEAVKRAGSLRKVPEADVLITNPTQLAIALQYQRGIMAAPKVIAKGAGALAGKMRLVAKQHSVPIVENKPLARALFKQAQLEGAIPESLFPVVAKIMAWIFLQREKNLTRRAQYG